MSKEIIVFAKENCAPCSATQDFLKEKGVKFSVVHAFDEPELAVKYSVMSVPTTVLLENEDVVQEAVGFVPHQFEEMIEKFSDN